ncbi:MAG: HD domain-containing protein [Clostridia bacterium]|nr:HD domain-containing protein [Clostridia bacterium]
MELDLEEQKQKFLDICQSVIHRPGLDGLLNWLSAVDFFEAPASTKFHGAYKGGLCQHSLDVYDYALKLRALTEASVDDESLAIAALFHDVCKCKLYKTEYRNQKINGEWQQVPVYVINESLHFGGHGSKSVYQVQYFMRLEKDEAVAINCHMGFADASPSVVRDVSNAFQDFPLAWIIHAADEAATFLLKR